MKSRAVVHGHFYQPPRENPWTGEVERQPSAGRDHDWNARVARECYVPNGEARVVDGAGRIAELVDNYEWMSFDFGPTLLSWLEKAEPEAYARLLAADRRSAARLSGHGNAMAQGFHHAILPLSHPRDRRTELRWGLADFERRFGRKAEGLWLPECAVDDATLADVAAEGVQFTILEPHQAEGPVTPGAPYLWRGGGRELALFFYDGALSRAVAFERAMSDSRAFAERVAAAASPAHEGAALIATDGESYGHHDAFAEMGLAHLLRHALPERGVEPVNLAYVLSRHPARREVSLKAGGSSWSCAHGLERWRSDCGCGAEGGRHQSWRAPLRAALEALRARLAELYERESAGLMPDPWAARDAYIAVVLDRSEENVRRFLAAHAPGAKGAEGRAKAVRLLELQRHALMMFTSCGWFFDELSRLEPTQVLLYAARALELARELGHELEPEFVKALKAAPSNEPRFGDGAGVWEKLVAPRVLTREHTAAHYAVSLLFEDRPPAAVHGHAVRPGRVVRRVEGATTAAAAQAEFVDALTGETWTRALFSAVLPGQRVQAYVALDGLAPERLDALLSAAASGEAPADLPPGRVFRLRDLRPDERERALRRVLSRRLDRWEAGSRELMEEALPLAEEYRGLGVPAPEALLDEAKLATMQSFDAAARRFAGGEASGLEAAAEVLARAKAAGLEASWAAAEEPWSRGVQRLLDALEAEFSPEGLRALRRAAELAREAGLGEWRPRAQTRYFRLLKARGAAAPPEALDAARALDIAV